MRTISEKKNRSVTFLINYYFFFLLFLVALNPNKHTNTQNSILGTLHALILHILKQTPWGFIS